MGYNENIDKKFLKKHILDFHLSHRTNPRF